MSATMYVFDRATVRRHRDRAAAGREGHDFLLREVGERLADRLDDITRRFPVALDLGCHGGELGRLLNGRGGIEIQQGREAYNFQLKNVTSMHLWE